MNQTRFMPEISLASTDEEIARCFPVMAQLRPHLSEAEFLKRVRRMAELYNFQLLSLKAQGDIRALAGFRLTESLYYGRFLYVDDLITSEESRSRGYGGMLFDWLVEHAKKNGCDALALDSGVQRFGAHRFYLTKRMDIACHHFSLRFK